MVKANELGGRFVDTNEGHQQPFWFYLSRLVSDKAMGHLLALLLPAAVFFAWKNKGAVVVTELAECAGAKEGTKSDGGPIVGIPSEHSRSGEGRR